MIRLILTKKSLHKTLIDALGEARHFVSSPREVNKFEEKLAQGEELIINANDVSRRTPILYSVRLEFDDKKVVQAPPEPKVPTELSLLGVELASAGIKLNDQVIKKIVTYLTQPAIKVSRRHKRRRA